MSRIKDYFENYPDSDKCFATSDGYVFARQHDADAHGNTLRDTKVKEYNRGDVEEKAPEDTEGGTTDGGSEGGKTKGGKGKGGKGKGGDNSTPEKPATDTGEVTPSTETTEGK